MKRVLLLFSLFLAIIPASAGIFGRKKIVAPADTSSADLLMQYAGNIHQFNQIFPQEKVYLEFDNTAYFQGEAIWFKAFVTETSTLKRGPSKVLYVDLLGPGGALLQRQKLKVIAGQADGGIALMDAATAQAREKRGMTYYPSGYYEVRAYTQNMLDFSPEASFSRVFPVYELPKKEGLYERSIIREEEISEYNQKRQEPESDDKKINVDFYPEGGDIVVGLPANIAFKAYGPLGESLNGTLTIDDDLSAHVEHEGMGSFFVIPDGTSRESVKFVAEDGSSKRFRLPKPLKSGFSMIVSENSDTCLKADIYHTSDRTETEVGLAVSCRGELIGFEKIIMADTMGVSMDCSSWPVGVCRITLYNRRGEILSSRSLFHGNDRFVAPKIVVGTDSMTRMSFGKQVMELDLIDRNGNPIRDRFCLSVSDIADYGNGHTDNILTNLLLSSDLRGYIRRPDYYMESRDAEHLRALDLLTLVQGWERYEWRNMTGLDEFNEKHRIEDSLTMNGWILTYRKREPVENVIVRGSVVPRDKSKFSSLLFHTEEIGYFGFDLNDFYNTARMGISVLRSRRNGKREVPETKHRIKLERSDIPVARAVLPAEKDLLEHNSCRVDFVDDKKKDTGLAEVINEDLGVLLDEVDVTAERRFIDYDTFVAFDARKDAEMVLDEGNYTSDVFDYLMENTGYPYRYPVFFYVHNSKEIPTTKGFDNPLEIDMIDVKSILVFDDPMYRRDIYDLTPLLNEFNTKKMNVNYLVDVYSDVNRYILVDILVKEDYQLLTESEIRNLSQRETSVEGFSEPVQFYSPQYPNGPVHGDVDFRRTLYWNPNVITDENGHARVEFYNNGTSKQFRIRGAGLTASGTPYVLDMNW